MAGPIGPAGVVGQLGVGGLMEPRADAAALVLERGAQLAHHQRIGHKVQREHDDPAEDDLNAVKIDKPIQNISKPPYCRKSHGRQCIPFDFFRFLHHTSLQ